MLPGVARSGPNARTQRNKDNLGETFMTLMKKFLGAAAVTALSAGAALAEPGLIIDLGGKFDKSFNESAYNGAQRWVEETGGSYMETELQSEAQREQTMRRMARTRCQPRCRAGLCQRFDVGKGGPRLSRHAIRDRRHGRRPAQRAIGRVFRA